MKIQALTILVSMTVSLAAQAQEWGCTYEDAFDRARTAILEVLAQEGVASARFGAEHCLNMSCQGAFVFQYPAEEGDVRDGIGHFDIDMTDCASVSVGWGRLGDPLPTPQP